jgi:O-succinylbenzoic acid--CoA ligase
VGLALPAGTDLVVLLHACWMAGAVAVPHDLRLTEAERPAADHVVDAVAPRPVDGTSLHREHDLAATAVLLQTSGTSGAPKPVELSFGNLLWSALGSGVALGTHPAERWLCALPLAHVGGLGIVVRSAIGATTALVHPGWDTERVLGALERDGVTLVSVVPTTLARLLDAGPRRPPHLRCALAGGAPVPPALVRRALRAGIPVAQTYGLTEATSQVTTAAPGDAAPDAGPPLFCTRVRIAPDGEIHVAGPTVAGPPGRELATGDLGALDPAGRLTVTGRKADTIVSGGENVAPAEVEAVLAEHPAVSEAVVLGRPHPEWGEAVVARVVLRPGAHASEAELRRHAAERLAGFKVPKEIAFTSALPRTRSGKILRRAPAP